MYICQAQADREAAKSHLSPKINIANSLEDDIEIFFTDDEAEQEVKMSLSLTCNWMSSDSVAALVSIRSEFCLGYVLAH